MRNMFVLALIVVSFSSCVNNDKRPECFTIETKEVIVWMFVLNQYTGLAKQCVDGKIRATREYEFGKAHRLQKVYVIDTTFNLLNGTDGKNWKKVICNLLFLKLH